MKTTIFNGLNKRLLSSFFIAALCALGMMAGVANAATAVMVQDIYSGGNSSPENLVNINGTVYFRAYDGTHGTELWKTNESGTSMVKDIKTGTDSGSPNYLTNVNGTLYFAANDGVYGNELWKSDGTSEGTVMVKDIKPGQYYDSSSPDYLINVNGTLYFGASDAAHGYELWKSDGTESGTVIVKDIISGSSSSWPYYFTNLNGTLYFTASDGSNGTELWKSDGTSGGTVMVKDIMSGSAGSDLNGIANVNGTLFFRANDGSYNGYYQLWKSDGTSGGTVKVKNICPECSWETSGPDQYASGLGLLFFTGTDNGGGNLALWRSDGTEAGTYMVMTVYPSYSYTPFDIVEMNGYVYFTANDYYGMGLWKSDGTVGGTSQVRYGDFRPSNIISTGSALYFKASEGGYWGAYGYEIWTSDGTFNGTKMVKDIRPGTDSSLNEWSVVPIVNANGIVYFPANDGTNGVELWKIDTVSNPAPSLSYTSPSSAYVGGSSITLWVYGSDFVSNSVIKWDGDSLTTTFDYDTQIHATLPQSYFNSPGTHYVTVTNPTPCGGTSSSYSFSVANPPPTLTTITPICKLKDEAGFSVAITGTGYVANSVVKFSANSLATTFVSATQLTATVPDNLLSTAVQYNVTVNNPSDNISSSSKPFTVRDSTSVPCIQKDIYAGNQGANISNLVNVNGTLFFRGWDLANGLELWKSNGSENATVLVKDINPGNNGHSTPSNLTNVNGVLYFSADDGTHGTELWKSDGTDAGTVMVKDIFNTGNSSSNPANLTNVNGTLFFTANDGTNGVELWMSDGTSGGTTLVKDIYTGSSNSSVAYLTNVNGLLYFSADDGSNGMELWKSDGTSLGTSIVKNINSGSNSSWPNYLTSINGTLYFSANDGTNGVELWKSTDGTSLGTSMVKDIFPGIITSSPQNLTNIAGTLYFSANDGSNGRELWKSTDGTSSGTSMVKDIYPGSSNSSPQYFTNLNGTVYFMANDGTNGVELWRSDGTDPGTSMVKNTVPGSYGVNMSSMVNVNGTLYFDADDYANRSGTWGYIYGRELWKSDGTDPGTVLVKDIYPGTNASSPTLLTNVNEALYFVATDGSYGQELWMLGNPAPYIGNVNPSNGPTEGGTIVTITGSNFRTGATVTFGATPSSSVTIDSINSLRATAPLHAAGAVNVTVTNTDSTTVTLTNGYTYDAAQLPAPTITSYEFAVGATAIAPSINAVGTDFVDTVGEPAQAFAIDDSNNTQELTDIDFDPPNAVHILSSLDCAHTTSFFVKNHDGQESNRYPFDCTAFGLPPVCPAIPLSTVTDNISDYIATKNIDDFNIGHTINVAGSTYRSYANFYDLMTIGVNRVAQIPQVTINSGNTGIAVQVQIPQCATLTGDSVWDGRIEMPVDSGGNITNAQLASIATSGKTAVLKYATLVGDIEHQFTSDKAIRIKLAGQAGYKAGYHTGLISTSITKIGAECSADTQVAGNQLSEGGNCWIDVGADKIIWTKHLTQFFTYDELDPTTVTNVDPDNGPSAGGSFVTITGTGFRAGAVVKFATAGFATPGLDDVTVIDSSTITATTKAYGVGPVNVIVTNSDQTYGIKTNGFTFNGSTPTPPVVSNVVPDNGIYSGGTVVTVSGSNFSAPVTVLFGGSGVGGTVVDSSTITVTTPTHAVGNVRVAVRNADASLGVKQNAFDFTPGGSPSTCPSTAGNSSTVEMNESLQEDGLADFNTEKTFNIPSSLAQADINLSSLIQTVSSSKTARLPKIKINYNSSTHGVVVDIPQCTTVNSATGWIGKIRAPKEKAISTVGAYLNSIRPAGGGLAAVDSVISMGDSSQRITFDRAVRVKFIGMAGKKVGYVSGATIIKISNTCSADTQVAGDALPAGGDCSMDVGEDKVVWTKHFTDFVTYDEENPPTVTGVTPAIGSQNGGTHVTVAGTNFGTGATVTFGGTLGNNVDVLNNTQIAIDTPAHATGAVDVVVTNPNLLQGTKTNGFTYVDYTPGVAPTITNISPADGDVSGSTHVTIRGTNFGTGLGVTFGGNNAAHVNVDNSTQIQLDTPPHTVGAVDVTVTNPDSMPVTSTGGYTYTQTGGTQETQAGQDYTQEIICPQNPVFSISKTPDSVNWQDKTVSSQEVQSYDKLLTDDTSPPSGNLLTVSDYRSGGADDCPLTSKGFTVTAQLSADLSSGTSIIPASNIRIITSNEGLTSLTGEEAAYSVADNTGNRHNVTAPVLYDDFLRDPLVSFAKFNQPDPYTFVAVSGGTATNPSGTPGSGINLNNAFNGIVTLLSSTTSHSMDISTNVALKLAIPGNTDPCVYTGTITYTLMAQ